MDLQLAPQLLQSSTSCLMEGWCSIVGATSRARFRKQKKRSRPGSCGTMHTSTLGCMPWICAPIASGRHERPLTRRHNSLNSARKSLLLHSRPHQAHVRTKMTAIATATSAVSAGQSSADSCAKANRLLGSAAGPCRETSSCNIFADVRHFHHQHL